LRRNNTQAKPFLCPRRPPRRPQPPLRGSPSVGEKQTGQLRLKFVPHIRGLCVFLIRRTCNERIQTSYKLHSIPYYSLKGTHPNFSSRIPTNNSFPIFQILLSQHSFNMVKIALIGAAGQIGTPLSLLCKMVSITCK
jgi:hypothetical protein